MHSPMTGWLGALLVVLIAGAAPKPALAQPLACSTIRPGQTAAQVAARIAGRAQSRHEPWFQIVDPAAKRFIPKAHYDLIHPGWQACIVNEPRQRLRPIVHAGTFTPTRTAGAGVAMPGVLNRIASMYVLWVSSSWPLPSPLRASTTTSGAGKRRCGA